MLVYYYYIALILFLLKMQSDRSHQSSFYSSRPSSNVKSLIILGESEVGKSTLLKSLTKSKFDPNYQTTIGLNYYVKEIEFNKSERVTFSIWDTSGDEIAAKILPQRQYKQCDHFIIVVSYDKKQSLLSLHKFINFISNYHDTRNTPILILITKNDIKAKEFTLKEVMKSIEDYHNLNINVCDISCVNIKSVEMLFIRIAALLIGKKLHSKSIASSTYTESNADTNADSVLIPLRKSFKLENNDESANSMSNLLNSESTMEKTKKCC